MATNDTLTPLFLRFQTEAHGIESIYKLSKVSKVAHSDLYNFLNGKGALTPLARQRLAAVLPKAHAVLVPSEVSDDAS